MSNGNEATVKFGFDGRELNRGVADTEKRLTRFAKNTEQGFGRLRGLIGSIGLGLLAKSSLDVVVGLDRMRRGMTTLEGSASKAALRMEELRQASKLPGVDFEQAVKADIQLRSVGLSADLSKQAIIEMGNALALSGNAGAEQLEGVNLALTQIVSLGKVTAEDLNQISGRVPKLRSVLNNVFGTASSEELQKMGLTGEEFVERMIGGFANLTRASAGMDEKIADFTTNVKLAQDAFMRGLVGEGIEGAARLGDAIEQNLNRFETMGSRLGTGAARVADFTSGLMDGLDMTIATFGIALEQGISPLKAQKIVMDGIVAARKADAEEAKKASETAAKNKKEAAAAAKLEITSKADAEKLAAKELQLIEAKRKAAEDDMSRVDRIRSLRAQDATLSIVKGSLTDPKAQIDVEIRRVAVQRELTKLRREESEHLREAVRNAVQKSLAAAKQVQAERAIQAQRAKSLQSERGEALGSLEVLKLRGRGRNRAADKLESQMREQAEVERLMGMGSTREQAERMAREREEAMEDIKRREMGLGPKSRKRGGAGKSFTGLDDWGAMQSRKPGQFGTFSAPNGVVHGFGGLSGWNEMQRRGPMEFGNGTAQRAAMTAEKMFNAQRQDPARTLDEIVKVGSRTNEILEEALSR